MWSPRSPVRGKARKFWTADTKIAFLAVLSRIVILTFSVLLDRAIPDHNPDASVARPPDALALPPQLLAFTRWDAAHFLQLAQFGYQEEKDFAFFPFLPLAINGLARILHVQLSWGFSLVLSGLLITNGCFVLSAWLLFRLGLAVLKDQILAFNAARVFCLSPANIFFSTIYTESPFAACTFGALLLLHMDRFYFSAVLFAIGSGLRSNGLVNIGFLACHVLVSTLKQIRQANSASFKPWNRAALRLMVGVIVVFSPFIAFQTFAVWKACDRDGQQTVCDKGQEQCAVSAEPPSWCQYSIPSAYSHIQAKYWQGGFLRYWQLKQIPNFLLAFPALSLTAAGVFYLFMDFVKELQREADKKGSKQSTYLTCVLVLHVALVRCPLFPHAVHWGFLAAYVFFFANVQISTRLLASACPVFHWFLASLVFDRSQYFRQKLLQLYIGLYNLLGVSMHVNFLPWT